LLAVVRDSGARLAMATAQTLDAVRRDVAQAVDLDRLAVVTVESLADDAASSWRHPGSQRDTLAFLQYTSGSTGT
ncbi:MAG: AMP-binding protein, partial [Actinomycetes bacterium]